MIGGSGKEKPMAAITAVTDRLILRSFRSNDSGALFEYLSDPETVAFEPYKPLQPADLPAELDRRIGDGRMIAAELIKEHKVIGNIWFDGLGRPQAELGFIFNRHYWHLGLAKEACMEVLVKAFGSGTETVTACCDVLNTNSWHLLESMNFTRTEHLVKNSYFWCDAAGNPLWKDTYVYKLNCHTDRR